MKILELFGGIGACSKALEKLKIDYEIVDYVEIDKYAVRSFNAINNTSFEPQDICKWDKNIEVDLIMHGSPCQDFSLAGLQAGGDKDSGTRSSLMYETLRIVEKLKPKYVIWENVKNLLSKKHKHNFDAYLEAMGKIGYSNYYEVLNAKDYGIPQNRERIFTVSIRNDIDDGFKFPPKQELTLRLKDMLEEKVEEKYYLSNKMVNYISKTGTANFKNHDSKINLDVARPLTTNQNKRAGTTNYFSENLPNNYNLEEVNRLYGIFDTKESKHQAGSVYDANGLSPTLDTMQGGYRQPCVEIIKDGSLYENKQAGTIYNKNGLCPTITTEASQNWNILLNEKIKIRKLTPKECWRLMGFDDEDFYKAKNIGISDTQLYKQAGNSIVVNVLEAILNNLLLEERPNVIKGQTSIFDFI